MDPNRALFALVAAGYLTAACFDAGARAAVLLAGRLASRLRTAS